MRRGFFDGSFPVVACDVPVQFIMVTEKENGIFNPIRDGIDLSPLDVFVGIADSYVDTFPFLLIFRLPLLSRPVGHREDVSGCLDRMAQIISVLKGNLPIDPVTRS